MPTIALVDDDRNILTSLRMVLEAEGYKTQTYNDGASALDGFAENPPDLAILDIKMPRMDGMELLRRLRQRTELPVIFLTSKDEEIDELFGLKMGADDFIRKPFPQRLLVERVKAVLRRAQPRDAPPRSRTSPRCSSAASSRWTRAPYLRLGQPAGDADRNRIPHLAGAGLAAGRGEKPRRPNGCGL